MTAYCTDAELAGLQPDLENATLHLTPDDDDGPGAFGLTLKSLIQRAVDVMAQSVDWSIEIQLPPEHSNHWLNAEQIRLLANRFGIEAKEP